VTTIEQLAISSARQTVIDTLHAHVGPRADSLIHSLRPVPSCGCTSGLEWLDVWHPSVEAGAGVYCMDHFNKHLGADAGDVHWFGKLQRCLAGCIVGGTMVPVQTRIRLAEPVLAEGGALIRDNDLAVVPLFWLCMLHAQAVMPSEIHIDPWSA
jgi:hypothetical protein